MLRKIRIILSLVCFSLMTLLFLDFTGTAQVWFGWMAKIQLLPAVLALNAGVFIGLLALTLIFGRFYCSIICPLGVMQDLFSCLGGKFKKNRFRYKKARPFLRYGVLVLFILLLCLGLHSIAVLIAPYSAYGRMASQLFAPVYLWVNNLLASIAEHYNSYAFYPVEVWMKSLPALIVAVLTFAVVSVWAFFGGRAWCNTICPVGSVLGFVSRFSLLKPRIDEDQCVHCGLCEKNCKANCIHSETSQIDYSRCVGCMDCVEHCHLGGIRYRRAVKTAKKGVSGKMDGKSVDTEKRDFLRMSGLFAGGMLMESAALKVDGGLAVIEDKQPALRSLPLRPAGSLGLQHFERHCTSCMLCVSACPNGVLRPSPDLKRLMQPEMSFERGYCRPECTRCSEVCPTAALRPVTVEEKTSIQTGHAVWIEKNCIVRRDGVHCEACMSHCPTGAIQLVRPEKGFGLAVPAIDTASCIACGACEYYCPSRPFSAIYVEGHRQSKNI